MKQNIRWGGLSVFHDFSPPPSLNESWSVNVERNWYRLLQAQSWNINNAHKINPKDFDAFLLPQFNIAWIDQETELAKKLHEGGCKVVTAYSHDMRFLIGGHLINTTTGTLWTAPCQYADVILSGLPDNLHMFGRYDHKVMQFGFPFERLNFNTTPYENRTIDLLVSGSGAMENLGYIIELLLFIKEKHPEKRIVFSINPSLANQYGRYSDKIEFVPGGLLELLKNTKVYLNPELRPRSGRAQHEAWLTRTPCISASTTYYSKLYHEYSYSKMCMYEILDCYDRLLSTMDYAMRHAEHVAESEYWDVKYPELINRLYPEQKGE